MPVGDCGKRGYHLEGTAEATGTQRTQQEKGLDLARMQPRRWIVVDGWERQGVRLLVPQPHTTQA